MRRLWAVCVLGLWVGLAQAAPPPDKREVAKALVTEGHTAWDRGEWATALARYQAAFAAYPAPNLHYDLGLAFEKLGHQVEALSSFQHFLAEAPGAPAEARTHAQERVVELEKLVPVLNVTTSVPGVSIYVDGKLAGTTPMAPLRLAAGVHEVKATKSDKKTHVSRITLDPGVHKELPIAMSVLDFRVPPPSPSPSPSATPLPSPAPAKKRSIFSRWWFWGGIGAVAVTAAVVVVATRPDPAGLPDSDLGSTCPFGGC